MAGMAGEEEEKIKATAAQPPRGLPLNCLLWPNWLLWPLLVAICVLIVLLVAWRTETYGPDFRVQSAIVSQLNATQSQLTATWDLSLVATNRNPGEVQDMYINRLMAYIFYGDKERMMMLAVKPVGIRPRLLLSSKRNQATASFQLQAVEMYVGQNVSQEILQGLSAPGSASGALVRFGLKLEVWYKGVGIVSDFRALFCDGVVDFGVSPVNYVNHGTGISTVKEGQSTECYYYEAKDFYY
ncbi:hypothetical protein D8674_027174 [Pyrus ussuriensis x Pyrus communis]|uniref:Late embryogenesis abundant protein LEA-2 subgroup domain-containing protein n=1 Tax=Pyrus ussuriensis x Pyrus communis TaxID=2448454 RepID=A0A5N5IG92_9ROSA|nr:hypothetical protein D8674_027174 [Pyrus ussuriensis x Pyrus communis]